MRQRDHLDASHRVIFDLTVGLAGYFLAAELGLMLSAILMIGGFLYAITNALDVLRRSFALARGASGSLGRAAVLTRLARLGLGKPGDVKPVGAGVWELRIDVGPG